MEGNFRNNEKLQFTKVLHPKKIIEFSMGGKNE